MVLLFIIYINVKFIINNKYLIFIFIIIFIIINKEFIFADKLMMMIIIITYFIRIIRILKLIIMMALNLKNFILINKELLIFIIFVGEFIIHQNAALQFIRNFL